VRRFDIRRGISAVAIGIALVAGVLPVAARQAADPNQILAQAREAMGGEKKLSAITSILATGRTRQVRGESLVPIEFEIAIQLPDKYVRKDEIPAQESGPTSVGFNGDDLIQLPAPPTAMPSSMPSPPASPPGAAAAPGRAGAAAPGRAGAPSPAAAMEAARKSRVASVKQDFAKLTLGMFATSFPVYPLTFTYAGQAEAPQGKADVIDAKAGAATLRLFISSQTHLPLMVSWTTPVTPASIVIIAAGQPKPATLPPGAIVVEGPAMPAATAPQEEKDQYVKDVQALRMKTLAGAKPIQNYIYYADYRDAGGGVQFPFRLRRAIGADTIEETNFDAFKLNVKIDPKKFEVIR
jgi:hypothetical protein